MSRSTATAYASVRWTYSLAIFPRSKPSKAPARQHNQAWLITTWLWVSRFFCAVWCRRPTEEWIVSRWFPACLRSTPICFLPSVSLQVQRCSARHECLTGAGIFNPKPDFDIAAEPTFGRNPRPAHENFYWMPAEQPDGLPKNPVNMYVRIFGISDGAGT